MDTEALVESRQLEEELKRRGFHAANKYSKAHQFFTAIDFKLALFLLEKLLLIVVLVLTVYCTLALTNTESIQAQVFQKRTKNGGSMTWPMFDCSRTARLYRSGVITYHKCLVDTTNNSMNPDTGIFRVAEGQEGIYQISFTAKYVANSNGRFGAWSDVQVNGKVVADSQRSPPREYNGNGGTEISTHSIILLHLLRFGDQVNVVFNKDGSSFIHSDDDHDVHFAVQKVSDLPQ